MVTKASGVAWCTAAVLSHLLTANAGVIGLAAAPEPLLGSKLSRPAAALLDEAACLLAANDTAALLTPRSACASFNATVSATDGVVLTCPAACRRELQQVDGRCRNELVAGSEFGPMFSRVFTACNMTFKDASAPPGAAATEGSVAASIGGAASGPGIAPAVPVPDGGPAEAPAPGQGGTRRVSGATLAAAGAAAAIVAVGVLGAL